MSAKPIEVRAESKYSLWLRFDDGTDGFVDLSRFSHQGVFNQWEEDDLFFHPSINEDASAIVWNNEFGLGSLALYLKIKEKAFHDLQPPFEIDVEKIRALLSKYFDDTLFKLGYSYTEILQTTKENYCDDKFTYSNNKRNIVFHVHNNDPILSYHLCCSAVIYSLPNEEKHENFMQPEYFFHVTKGKKMVYDGKYRIDENKNYLEELDRVMANYAQLLFTGELFKVIKGEKWYENIHVSRD